jgi:hypothetical protein
MSCWLCKPACAEVRIRRTDLNGDGDGLLDGLCLCVLDSKMGYNSAEFGSPIIFWLLEDDRLDSH